jgi:hypothetical protein
MSFGAPVRNGIGIGLKASTSLSTRGGNSGPAPGQQAYTTAGTYSWVAPAGVTSVCVVCVGGGAYMSAGGLGWKNDITVVPGDSYTVVVGNSAPFVGSNAGSSYFINLATVRGGGGSWGSASGGTFIGTGGGNGGSSSTFAGGGAGGYTGNGGTGAGGWGTNGGPGNGGGGGGGASAAYGTYYYAGGGGGVGILGQGANGAGGLASESTASGGGGGGGSGGANGASGTNYNTPGNGGLYGGGGGGGMDIDTGDAVYRLGGRGAVRILWGAGRAFPATNTGDV